MQATIVSRVTGDVDADTPRIWLCWAQSLDGALAQDARGRRPTNLTHDSLAAERLVHALRARADAVVVGVGTVCSDDPRLTVRQPDGTPAPAAQPDVVVLDPTLRCPPHARLFTAAPPDARTVRLVTTGLHWRADPGIRERARVLEEACGAVIQVLASDEEHINVSDLVLALAKPEVGALRTLHVEGGAHTLAQWAGVAHAQVTLVAPVVLGARALRVPWPARAAAAAWTLTQWYPLDDTIVCLVCV